MSDYKDPLHVPTANLVVWWKGKEHLVLNKQLLDMQNCWSNLELIKELHHKRLVIEDQMENLDAFLDLPDEVASLNEQWTKIQFELQEAWGFPKDARYHRFWDISACKCPKMDNGDAYPTGYYVTSEACKLHWGGTPSV